MSSNKTTYIRLRKKGGRNRVAKVVAHQDERYMNSPYLTNFSLSFQPGEAVSEKVLKSYCWMYSTFNIPRDFKGQCYRKNQSDNAVYNSYYQWVSIFLVCQAFLFYMPRVIWLMSEGGKSQYIYIRTVSS